MKIRNLIPTLFGFRLGPAQEVAVPLPAASILTVELDPLKPDTRELLERLDEIIAFKVGDPWPKSYGINWWGPSLNRLLSDAKAEIVAGRRELAATEELLRDEVNARAAAGVRSEDGT